MLVQDNPSHCMLDTLKTSCVLQRSLIQLGSSAMVCSSENRKTFYGRSLQLWRQCEIIIFYAYYSCYNRAMLLYAVIVCPSVCPSVCLSQVGVLRRWLNLGSRKRRHTITQRIQFIDAKDLDKIPTGSPPKGTLNRGGVSFNRQLLTNISLISVTVQDRDIVTMER